MNNSNQFSMGLSQYGSPEQSSQSNSSETNETAASPRLSQPSSTPRSDSMSLQTRIGLLAYHQWQEQIGKMFKPRSAPTSKERSEGQLESWPEQASRKITSESSDSELKQSSDTSSSGSETNEHEYPGPSPSTMTSNPTQSCIHLSANRPIAIITKGTATADSDSSETTLAPGGSTGGSPSSSERSSTFKGIPWRPTKYPRYGELMTMGYNRRWTSSDPEQEKTQDAGVCGATPDIMADATCTLIGTPEEYAQKPYESLEGHPNPKNGLCHYVQPWKWIDDNGNELLPRKSGLECLEALLAPTKTNEEWSNSIKEGKGETE